VAGVGGRGPERAGLARVQAPLAHDRADQFRGDALALTGQGGADPAVPVGLVGVGAFIFNSRTARSEIDSGGSSSTCSTRYLCTQLPRGAFVHLDLAGALGDRPRRLGHHLHGLVLELRRELSAPFSH